MAYRQVFAAHKPVKNVYTEVHVVFRLVLVVHAAAPVIIDQVCWLLE